jgi:1-acyl-sn-glycerol-3-phosphate acyltransferase
MPSGSEFLPNRLNHIWRLIGTGLSFFVFGLGGLVLGVIVFPLLRLVTRDPNKRRNRARRLIGALFWVFIRLMRGLGVLSFDISGVARLPADGNALIVANHPTLIDVVFLIALFPKADCVVKAALWRNPFTRHVLLAADHIPNDGGVELVDRCAERLQAGGSLILFPEGTRTHRDRKLRFKAGAAAVAARTGATLLPVLIECEPLTLGKGEPWYAIPPRKPSFHLEILAPLPLSDLIGTDGSERLRKRRLNTALKTYFLERLDGWH